MLKRRSAWSNARGEGEGLKFILDHAQHAGEECLLWPLSRDAHGYAIVAVLGKACRASRVMCEAAHGPAPSPKHRPGSTCRHGKHGCVNPRHIRWMTTREIVLLAYSATSPRKVKPSSPLTRAAVLEISAARGLETQAALGARFGVPASYVGKIHRAEIYTSGRRALDIPCKPRRVVRGIIRREPLLAYPFIRTVRPEHEMLLRINSILPRSMDDDRRADVGQQIALALLEGRISMDELVARGAGALGFFTSFYRDNFEQGGRACSFDAHAFHLTSDMGLGAMA